MADEATPKKPAGKKTEKVMDVAHPSKTSADPTSKPVIVGHTNTIKKDPMVSKAEPPKTEPSPEPTAPNTESTQSSEPQEPAKEEPILDKPKRELKLEPPSVTKDEPKEEAKANDATEEPTVEAEEVTSEPVSEEKPSEAESNPVPAEETENAPSDNAPGTADSPPAQDDEQTGEGSVNAVAEGVNTKKERLEEEDKQAKINTEIDGMITSKKYNVKIHSPAKTRSLKWLVLLIVVLALAGAAWYFAMGPGKDLWGKNQSVATEVQAPTTATETEERNEEAEPEEKTKAYENTELGISFTQPNDWQVEVVKDTEFDTRDVVTITSPNRNARYGGCGGRREYESRGISKDKNSSREHYRCSRICQ